MPDAPVFLACDCSAASPCWPCASRSWPPDNIVVCALKYFEEAYELSKRPELLYNIATTADRLRRDEAALSAYRQYLLELPEANNRGAVETRIATLERVRTEKHSAEATPALSPAAVAEAAQRSEQPAARSAPEASAAATTPERDAGMLSQWWFWAGVGGVVVTGVVVGLALGGEGDTTVARPEVVDARTRVVDL